MSQELVSHSPEETFALGKELGERWAVGTVVALKGDLGAGKTTLLKGIASGATGCHPDQVSSPTFVYLHVYEGGKRVHHFDLYRLKGENDFLAMGFDEYFHADGICCIEWSERIEGILPQDCVTIELSHVDETTRRLRIE